MTELPEPLMVRRSVCLGEAVYDGQAVVEGITALRVETPAGALEVLAGGAIPVLTDPLAACRHELHPAVLVDAIMAKRNTGTTMGDAPLVVALGPGFSAGIDCHAVVETNRGHWLGRVIWQGRAQPDTGVPGEIGGQRSGRVLRAPVDGVIATRAHIGDRVAAGQLMATVDGQEIRAQIDGVLRGLLRPGLSVTSGVKVGDIDPRAEPAHCFTISDKSLAVGGGVVEAILSWMNR
jgi:xanthine dehydrogenase accessory factor